MSDSQIDLAGIPPVVAITPAKRKTRARKASFSPLTYSSMDEADSAVVTKALDILARRLGKRGATMGSPQAVRDYCTLSIADRDHEVFAVLFLDAQHRLIASDVMFRGTLTQTSVYPREVVKAALSHNAAAVILTHNHPSGVAEPSKADERLTIALRDALAMVDVRVLDHIIVAGQASISFAERGLV